MGTRRFPAKRWTSSLRHEVETHVPRYCVSLSASFLFASQLCDDDEVRRRAMAEWVRTLGSYGASSVRCVGSGGPSLWASVSASAEWRLKR